MKKNMIALAVAGALVAPVAMAEVTVSGGLQAELVQIGGDAKTANGLYAADGWEATAKNPENAGNYGFLKFAASEDLGGGMKALAVYNMNANVGDESNAVGTRDAYVGLSAGSLGTILAGTLASPYKSSTVGYDPLLMTSFQARDNYGMSDLHNGYLGNAVAYANSFAGDMVKVVAALVLDENKDSTATDKTVGKHAKSISVNVAPISGLDVAVAWIDMSKMSSCSTSTSVILSPTSTTTTAPDGTVTTTGVTVANQTACSEGADKRSATKVGAKYTMGAFTVAGQVEMLDKGLTNSGEKGNIVYLTGSFNVNDANSISVAVGQQDKKVNGGDDGARYMAVGFKHAFSKNTSTTVGYRVSDNMATGGTKETAVGAGLRVAF